MRLTPTDSGLASEHSLCYHEASHAGHDSLYTHLFQAGGCPPTAPSFPLWTQNTLGLISQSLCVIQGLVLLSKARLQRMILLACHSISQGQ